MTITRNYDGAEIRITLTKLEMYEAYLEMQHHTDCEDVLSLVFDMSEAEIEGKYGVSIGEVYDLVDRIADEMRENMEAYDLSMYDARENAIEAVCLAFREEKNRAAE